jgi:predicted amidohydrolase
VDAGTSGWRNFPDLKRNIIDHPATRVLALLNIVGNKAWPMNQANRIPPLWIRK